MIMRQRSPSSMSFHPDEDGFDDLDHMILKHVIIRPGISIKELASRFVFYDRERPSEESRASYAQIWYRVHTLEKEGLLTTKKEPSNVGLERRCYPKNDRPS